MKNLIILENDLFGLSLRRIKTQKLNGCIKQKRKKLPNLRTSKIRNKVLMFFVNILCKLKFSGNCFLFLVYIAYHYKKKLPLSKTDHIMDLTAVIFIGIVVIKTQSDSTTFTKKCLYFKYYHKIFRCAYILRYT